ncbi:hypothetical protein F2Q68_00025430 [Brassica cretica]|uniref:Uncharacterized protein n=1 Tax=Brassica cretica TaxID=69181 RepID=A0A8S9I9R2_BRACR|nr:hypothetical protein F2Q68_00025430 [Brassica cretica]
MLRGSEKNKAYLQKNLQDGRLHVIGKLQCVHGSEIGIHGDMKLSLTLFSVLKASLLKGCRRNLIQSMDSFRFFRYGNMSRLGMVLGNQNRDIPTSETPTPPLLLMFRGSETNKAYLQKNLQDGRMYHELAKKTIEKVDKFEGQVNGLSHDVEELKHDNSMRGDNHLAAT